MKNGWWIRGWYAIYLMMMSVSYSTLHKDGCKELGDACRCNNAGLPGYCLPGFQSDYAGQLSCDCSSDVLSADEVIELVIQKVREDMPRYKRESLRSHDSFKNFKNGERYPEIFRALIALATGSPAHRMQEYREFIKKEMQVTPFLTYFFKCYDGCFYPGQVCICQNTQGKGVCEISRWLRKNELFCHCG